MGGGWRRCRGSDSGFRRVFGNGGEGRGGGGPQFTIIAVAYVAEEALAPRHVGDDCALSHGRARVGHTAWVDAQSFGTGLVTWTLRVAHTVRPGCGGQRDASGLRVALEAWWTLADGAVADDGALRPGGTGVGSGAWVHAQQVDACVNGGAL